MIAKKMLEAMTTAAATFMLSRPARATAVLPCSSLLSDVLVPKFEIFDCERLAERTLQEEKRTGALPSKG